MRHRRVSQRFGRRSDQRKALFKSLAISLITHEGIKTTVPKAKAVRGFIESLITLAKQDTVSKRRLAFARLRNKEAVAKLFVELGPRFQTRPGGYLRVLKCGFRKGDAAPMAFLELVERS